MSVNEIWMTLMTDLPVLVAACDATCLQQQVKIREMNVSLSLHPTTPSACSCGWMDGADS